MPKTNRDIIAALDIGTSKITALIGETQGNGDLTIIGEGTVPSEGLKNGMVVDLEAASQAIEQAMNKAESTANVEVDKVIIGISGKHIQCQNNRTEINVSNPLRGITEEDVFNAENQSRAVVIPEGRELLHALVQEIFVDDLGGVKNPIGMAGTRLAVDTHIVTGALTSSQNITKCVNEAGWKVETKLLQPIASALSVLTEDEKNLGVVMIDMGGGTMDMVVYSRGGIRHTQVIPMGGDYITSDIAYGLRVSRNDAELLKKTHGSALLSLVDRTEQIEIRGVVAGSTEMISPQRLIEIIAPRIQEMLVLVKEEMNQIPSRTRNPAGIVLTGGVTLMPGVREVAERVFNLPVRLAAPEKFQGFEEIVKQPTYSTAVGLLLYGMKMRMESTERHKNIIEKIYDFIREFLEKYL